MVNEEDDWLLSKMRNMDEIELRLGDMPYSLEKIVKTASKVQKKKVNFSQDHQDRASHQGTSASKSTASGASNRVL